MVALTRSRISRLWPVTLASLIALAILLALGFWQLERRTWKHALIARIDAALAAEPVDAENLIGTGHPWPQDFTKVTATGRFGQAERHLFTSYEGRPGWRVISPFMLNNGQAILVDRGFAPQDNKGTLEKLPQGDVSITGVIRLHEEGQGLFTPDNQPQQDLWYWWDLGGLIRSLSPAVEGRPVLPLVIQMTPAQSGANIAAQGWPQPTPARPELSDRHLGYAITWFGLAACLIGVYLVYVRSLLRDPVKSER